MPRQSTPSDHGPGLDLAAGVWLRRKRLALLVFVAAFAGIVSLTQSLPNLYRATATVLVERQQVSEAFVRPSVTAELETRIQTIHKQVMSRARLSDVITRFNLYPELRGHVPIDALVERMRADVEFGLSGVEQMTGRTSTIAFTVSYSGRDPVTVAEIANMLVASYVEENTRSRERQAVRTAEFLKTQLDEIKRDLDVQQQRQGEFKLRHTGELPDQLEVNLAALDRLNTQLRQNGEYQLRAIERRERLEAQLDTVAALPSPSEPSTPSTQLAGLRQRLAELQRTFSDQYPDVVRTKAEIAQLEAQGAAVGINGHTPAPAYGAKQRTEQSIVQAQSELASLQAEAGRLRRLITEYETRVENAPRRQQELQQLSQNYTTSQERYQTFLKRYEEAQVAENLEQGQNVEQFRILDPALPATAPSAPNRLWLLAIGFVGSLALAFAAVVAAERLDTSFHSVDELRAFAAVPTLAVIRRIPTRSAVRGRRIRFAIATVVVVVGLALIVGGARYVGAGNEQLVRMTARGRG
jgi:polysaccharide biosynthesis transport protein